MHSNDEYADRIRRASSQQATSDESSSSDADKSSANSSRSSSSDRHTSRAGRPPVQVLTAQTISAAAVKQAIPEPRSEQQRRGVRNVSNPSAASVSLRYSPDQQETTAAHLFPAHEVDWDDLDVLGCLLETAYSHGVHHSTSTPAADKWAAVADELGQNAMFTDCELDGKMLQKRFRLLKREFEKKYIGPDRFIEQPADDAAEHEKLLFQMTFEAEQSRLAAESRDDVNPVTSRMQPDVHTDLSRSLQEQSPQASVLSSDVDNGPQEHVLEEGELTDSRSMPNLEDPAFHAAWFPLVKKHVGYKHTPHVNMEEKWTTIARDVFSLPAHRRLRPVSFNWLHTKFNKLRKQLQQRLESGGQVAFRRMSAVDKLLYEMIEDAQKKVGPEGRKRSRPGPKEPKAQRAASQLADEEESDGDGDSGSDYRGGKPKRIRRTRKRKKPAVSDEYAALLRASGGKKTRSSRILEDEDYYYTQKDNSITSTIKQSPAGQRSKSLPQSDAEEAELGSCRPYHQGSSEDALAAFEQLSLKERQKELKRLYSHIARQQLRILSTVSELKLMQDLERAKLLRKQADTDQLRAKLQLQACKLQARKEEMEHKRKMHQQGLSGVSAGEVIHLE